MNIFYRVFYLAYRVITAVRSRAERRFTPAGLAVLAGAGIALMMSVDTDNNVDYQAVSLLLLALLIAGGFTLFFPRRFAAQRLLPRFGTVDTPLSYTILLRNLGLQTQSGLTLLEDADIPPPSFREWVTVQQHEQKHFRSFRIGQPGQTSWFKAPRAKNAPVPTMPGGKQVEVRVELTPVSRGMLWFRGVTLGRPDPLGLCRAFSRVTLPQSMLILPKRYLLPPIALPGTMKYQQGGVAQASNVGQSEEFVALREYRSGDPLRHIHWRSWARVGKPVVKEFEDEFFVRHALVLDTFTSHGKSEVFEEAVSVAASFACNLQTQESLLDLLFVGTQSYCFTAGRGLAHSEQLLEVLASVQACPDKPFSALEAVVMEQIQALSGCVCVLLAWDEPRRNFVEKLQCLGLPLLVLVVVPFEQEQTLDPGPMKSKPGLFHVLRVGQIERDLANISGGP